MTFSQSLESGFAGYNTYGYPGLIDMPSAYSRPDAELSFTSSHFNRQTRNTLTFQITPRLSGSFRYAQLYGIAPTVGGPVEPYRFDRSFSVHYRLFDETERRPAIAVGLNDFLGTGLYSSEYLVATKSLSPRLRVTGGLGWGRLGTQNGFSNPLGLIDSGFDTRPPRTNAGGTVRIDNWFKGDAALFGGLEYRLNERVTLTAEYSSDAYPNEDGNAFVVRSPLNFGVTWAARPGVTVSGHYLYGSELGAQVTLALNPKIPPAGPGLDRAPLPVLPRSSVAALGWAADTVSEPAMTARLAKVLDDAGLRLLSARRTGSVLRVEVENRTWPAMAQAVGRAARAMTHAAPAAVDTFVIVPVVSGIPASSVTLRRGDLEELEHAFDGSWTSFARAGIDEEAGRVSGAGPRFEWKVKPYLQPSLFDPDNPWRADVGAEVSAEYEPVPGLILSGTVRKKAFGNLDQSSRPSTSVLPHVRSDFNLYEREGDPAITELAAAYYFRPGGALYGRVTAGYLEPMFGGVSGELLWKPVDSRLAFGVEVNHVRQRDYDQLFGFQDYSVTTGHVSGYYDIGNGFHAQLDYGRYLAGDWGATLTLDREFRNGWKVGAFATLTNVSFDDFGEGSFDKGLRITIPISWASGQPNTDAFSTVIRPVTRDGGARLNVSGRLYETVRGAHTPALQDTWGRFWK